MGESWRSVGAEPDGLDPKIHPCGCVKVHQPALRMTERHHIMPLGYGGPDRADNWVTLCPTGHYVVHYHFLEPWIQNKVDPATLVGAGKENTFLWHVALEGYRRIKGLTWQPLS